MNVQRKPVAFGDMRNWMKALKAANELREIEAEVDWNVELGTITRVAQGAGTGPALSSQMRPSCELPGWASMPASTSIRRTTTARRMHSRPCQRTSMWYPSPLGQMVRRSGRIAPDAGVGGR